MIVILQPREHCDLGDLPPHLAGELGPLIVRVERAVDAVGEIGRVHVGRWGDGSAHLHFWFIARPAACRSSARASPRSGTTFSRRCPGALAREPRRSSRARSPTRRPHARLAPARTSRSGRPRRAAASPPLAARRSARSRAVGSEETALGVEPTVNGDEADPEAGGDRAAAAGQRRGGRERAGQRQAARASSSPGPLARLCRAYTRCALP